MIGSPDQIDALAAEVRTRAAEVRSVAADHVDAGQSTHWVSRAGGAHVDAPGSRPRVGRPGLCSSLGVAGLCLGALLPGCASSGSAGDDDTGAVAVEEAADLQEQFEQLPGVTSASVEFQDDITVQAQLQADVRVATAADVAATFPAVEEASWSSDIDPLERLTISVRPADQPSATRAEDYDLSDEDTRTQLTDRWGERP